MKDSTTLTLGSSALVRPLRAKVIAAYFNESPTIERLREIAIAFHQEAAALMKLRNVKTEGSMLAVLREQDLKWKAFARICPDVKPGAFQAVTHELVPETRALWPNDEMRDAKGETKP